MRVIWIAGLTLFFAAFSGVHANPRPAEALTAVQREELRYKLENLFNQADLLIRNESADRADLRRMEREAEVLGVYERFPLEEDLSGLRSELAEGARERGIELLEVRAVGRERPHAVPEKIASDTQPPFRLKPAQLAGEICVDLRVRGRRDRIEKWIASWPNETVRWVEPRGSESLRSLPQSAWRIQARTYRFRRVEFPRIMLRDPLEVLPAWARSDPQRFARQEPVLWSFVTRARELQPRAQTLAETKRRFLLQQARMEFFLSKTARP